MKIAVIGVVRGWQSEKGWHREKEKAEGGWGGHMEEEEEEEMEEEEKEEIRRWPKRGPGFAAEVESRDQEELEEEYNHISSRGAPERGNDGERVRGRAQGARRCRHKRVRVEGEGWGKNQ